MTARVFEGRCVWRLTVDSFAAAADLLARAVRVELAAAPVDAVVGVACGGKPLAERLARTLALPVLIVQARHNRTTDVGVPASGDVRVRTSASLRRVRLGSRLVIADDICGTGATLAAVTETLTVQLAADVVSTVTLCRNCGATGWPDVWVWDVADWVAFPWEPSPRTDLPVLDLPYPTGVRKCS